MKIIITALILINILIGCSNNIEASGSENNYTNSTCVYHDDYQCQVHIIKIKGHEYILSYTLSMYGGTCIIHAAHCPCNNH